MYECVSAVQSRRIFAELQGTGSDGTGTVNLDRCVYTSRSRSRSRSRARARIDSRTRIEKRRRGAQLFWSVLFCRISKWWSGSLSHNSSQKIDRIMIFFSCACAGDDMSSYCGLPVHTFQPEFSAKMGFLLRSSQREDSGSFSSFGL